MSAKKTGKRSQQHNKNSLLALATLVLIALIGLGAYWLINPDNMNDDKDLSRVGKGMNTIVSIHDPNCPHCQALKKQVDLVRPEFDGKIKFLIADLQTDEGRFFAQYHQVRSVTLVFFNPEGQKITILEGEQTADFLRKAFQKAFKLNT